MVLVPVDATPRTVLWPRLHLSFCRKPEHDPQTQNEEDRARPKEDLQQLARAVTRSDVGTDHRCQEQLQGTKQRRRTIERPRGRDERKHDKNTQWPVPAAERQISSELVLSLQGVCDGQRRTKPEGDLEPCAAEQHGGIGKSGIKTQGTEIRQKDSATHNEPVTLRSKHPPGEPSRSRCR